MRAPLPLLVLLVAVVVSLPACAMGSWGAAQTRAVGKGSEVGGEVGGLLGPWGLIAGKVIGAGVALALTYKVGSGRGHRKGHAAGLASTGSPALAR